ncbi:MAG: DegT/DnrJ/EryC1/StrS family aminotransferase [Sandaracinaceae bacterium]|nr:DegT/DnrJ/EryC1/StrS family aminotransferase [Sandaracinaceae bacterium]
MQVPFYRPEIDEASIEEVVNVLRGGWLTSGPRVKQFEADFAQCVGAKHAIAVNSCTAALHLAVEALGLAAGEAVLVPAHTFAATAEIVRYMGAIPILVDSDPVTLHIDLDDVDAKVEALRAGSLTARIPKDVRIVGMIPVHLGGVMMDMDAVHATAKKHDLWIVEDAAHSFPAAWRKDASKPFVRCGEDTSSVTCFSFYANKTITTGEGGMAVTADPKIAERMRLMCLHGLSRDAWDRFSGGRVWDYRIVAPGFKYNMTDVAAATGIHQLRAAQRMRKERESIALSYNERLASITQLELPHTDSDRQHAWHLYPVRLRTEQLRIDRNQFIELLKDAGVGCSVHYRPLHLHDYYIDTYGWLPEHCPVSTREWQRLISIPIFSGMKSKELDHVVSTLASICATHAR